jgi:hypothetical protein
MKQEIYKSKNMKRYLLIFALLLGAVSSWGQDLSKDFVVIDPSSPNTSQLKAQYSGPANVFYNDNPKPAVYIIGAVLENKEITDLHLFVATQPGRLIFSSGTVTAENAANFTDFFAKWKPRMKGKVIIHSGDVFTSESGEALRAKLQELTGLDFITP